MNRFIHRAAVALVGAMVPALLSMGAAGASPTGYGGVGGGGNHNATAQGAEARSASGQFLPINANVPISVLSLWSNNGSVRQSNNSVSLSNAGEQHCRPPAGGPTPGLERPRS